MLTWAIVFLIIRTKDIPGIGLGVAMICDVAILCTAIEALLK
jgi:hypothetical protein